MAATKSPLGDGSSGAPGNGASGANSHAGTSPRQKMGSDVNPQSVAAGGKFLRLDPPSDRSQMIGTTADPAQRRPFKLAGASVAPPSEDDEGDGGPVGALPVADEEA